MFHCRADKLAPCLAPCRGLLGYLHNVRGIPADIITLRSAIPSSEKQGVAVAFEYIQWLGREKSISVRTEGLVVRSVMQLAKFLYHSDSTVRGWRS
jgi:hypothetical protein